MPRRPAVPGHGLTMYGNPFDAKGRPCSTYVSVGHGRCKCGAQSPEPLPTNADRRDWWRSHCDEMTAAATPALLAWDVRQQPDIRELAVAVRRLYGGHLHEVDTGTDEYAIVLARTALDDEAVAEMWRQHWEGETP